MIASPKKRASRRPRDDDHHATRDRLLEVAAGLFAEHGKDAVGVREITKGAQANLAAIAYHFGGKDDLYVATLRHALGQTVRRMLAFVEGEGDDAPAALRAHIGGMCEALIGEKADPVGPRLILRELTAPTGALELLVDELMRPNFRRLLATLDALAAPQIDRETLPLHVMSIVGQIMHYRHTAPIVKRLLGRKTYPPGFAKTVAEHVRRLALLGIGRPDLIEAEAAR